MKIHVKEHQEARRLLKENVSHEADDVKNEQLITLKLIFLTISLLLQKLCKTISDFKKHSDSDEVHEKHETSAELVCRLWIALGEY